MKRVVDVGNSLNTLSRASLDILPRKATNSQNKADPLRAKGHPCLEKKTDASGALPGSGQLQSLESIPSVHVGGCGANGPFVRAWLWDSSVCGPFVLRLDILTFPTPGPLHLKSFADERRGHDEVERREHRDSGRDLLVEEV